MFCVFLVVLVVGSPTRWDPRSPLASSGADTVLPETQCFHTVQVTHRLVSASFNAPVLGPVQCMAKYLLCISLTHVFIFV